MVFQAEDTPGKSLVYAEGVSPMQEGHLALLKQRHGHQETRVGSSGVMRRGVGKEGSWPGILERSLGQE